MCETNVHSIYLFSHNEKHHVCLVRQLVNFVTMKINNQVLIFTTNFMRSHLKWNRSLIAWNGTRNDYFVRRNYKIVVKDLDFLHGTWWNRWIFLRRLRKIIFETFLLRGKDQGLFFALENRSSRDTWKEKSRDAKQQRKITPLVREL